MGIVASEYLDHGMLRQLPSTASGTRFATLLVQAGAPITYVSDTRTHRSPYASMHICPTLLVGTWTCSTGNQLRPARNRTLR